MKQGRIAITSFACVKERRGKEETDLTLSAGVLELHVGEFVEGGAHSLANDGPGDTTGRLRSGLHDVSRLVVEVDNVAHHPHSFVERTVPNDGEEAKFKDNKIFVVKGAF